MSLALWSVKLCFRGIDSWISSNCRWYGGIFSPLLFIETDLVIHNAFCQSKFPVVHKSTCWLASNHALTLHLKLPTPSGLINQNTGQFNLVPLSSLLYPSFVLSLYLDSFIMTIWNHMEIDMKNYNKFYSLNPMFDLALFFFYYDLDLCNKTRGFPSMSYPIMPDSAIHQCNLLHQPNPPQSNWPSQQAYN